MRIGLFADVRDWAFDVKNRDIAKFALADQRCEYFYVDEWMARRTPFPQYDLVFLPFHRWPLPPQSIPWSRALGALRSRWLFVEKPGEIGEEGYAIVNRFLRFQVVCPESVAELSPRCPGIVYLTNPVNTERFPPTEVRHAIVAEWNGNAAHGNGFHGEVKGIETIIKPSCRRAGIELNFAEYNSRRIAHADMPAFYRTANVALCASKYEGASNSVMEAMASGLALISTNCGNIQEIYESQMQHLGASGILIVDRSIEAFVAALNKLKALGADKVLEMGRLNREEIEARWSWRVWADRYRQFFLGT